jgi:hypothetical protein
MVGVAGYGRALSRPVKTSRRGYRRGGRGTGGAPLYRSAILP